MATYFISYDLRNKRDYKKIQDELDKYGAVMVLESLYSFKKENTTAKNLLNHFRSYIDKDDGMIVIESADWSSISTENTPNDI